MKNSSKWNFKGGLEGAPQQLRVEQKGHYSVTCPYLDRFPASLEAEASGLVKLTSPYFAYLSRQQMFERIFHGFRTKLGLKRWFTTGNLPSILWFGQWGSCDLSTTIR